MAATEFPGKSIAAMGRSYRYGDRAHGALLQALVRRSRLA